MRLGIMASVLLLTASAPAMAQNLDSLRQALDQMPAMILANPEPSQAYFVDVAVLQKLATRQGVELTRRVVSRAQLGAELRPVEALYYGKTQDWSEKAGIPLGDVSYFAGFGREPRKVSIWGLKDAAAAASLLEGLADRGFAPTGGEGVLGNGKPFAVNLAKRDPGDPWRSKVGAATFAAAKGAAVIQSAAPDAMPKLLAETPSAGSAPIVKAAMAGLESAIGNHAVVQAMLISPLLGMARLDPGILLTPNAGDLDAIKEKLAAQIEAGRKGIPPYFGGIIADAQLDHPAVAISLAYADCETAGTAARLMEQLWLETMPEAAQGTISSRTVASPDDLCAATLTIVSGGTDHTVNPAFSQLLNAYKRRSLSVLQIGESS